MQCVTNSCVVCQQLYIVNTPGCGPFTGLCSKIILSQGVHIYFFFRTLSVLMQIVINCINFIDKLWYRKDTIYIRKERAPPRERWGPLQCLCGFPPDPCRLPFTGVGLYMPVFGLEQSLTHWYWGCTCRHWVIEVSAGRRHWRWAQNVGVGL